MSLFGPVFYYDLMRQSRRRFVPALRILYLVTLFLVLYVGGSNWLERYPDGTMPQGALVRFVEQFFASFLVVQFLVVLALTPALTAGAITEEKESQTLLFVLASPLHRHEIILGKLASRLAAMLLIVLAGLPVFSLLQLIGGVDPGWLWAGFAATGVTMLSLAAVGILWSTLLRKSRDAILFTYLTPPAYVVLSTLGQFVAYSDWGTFPSSEDWISPITLADLSQIFSAGDPLVVLRRSILGLRGGLAVEDTVLSYSLFHGVVTVLSVGVAMLLLRRLGQSEVVQKQKKGKAQLRKRLLFGGRPTIGKNPVLWREVYAERGRIHWLARLVVLFFVALTFLPLIFIYVEYLKYPFWRSWSSEIHEWARIVGTLVACLLLLGIGIRAAGTFTNERHKQTFDVLLTTTLSTDEILLGKFLGCLASIGWGWVWLGTIAGIGLLFGGLSIAAIPLLCLAWGSYASFLAILGMRLSLTARTSLQSTVRTIGLAALLWFGPYALLGCCATMMFFRGDSFFVELVVGFMPPSGLYCLAFGTEDHSMHREEAELIAYSILGAIFWTVAAVILWNLTREEFRKLAGRHRSGSRQPPRPESDEEDDAPTPIG